MTTGMGSGTTGVAALALGRQFIGFDITQSYVDSTTDLFIGGADYEQQRLPEA